MTEDRQQFYDGVGGVLERLADRLPPADLETFRSLHDVGEPVYLLNLLCAGLIKWRTPVSVEERGEISALLNDLQIPEGRYPFLDDRDDTLARMNVVS